MSPNASSQSTGKITNGPHFAHIHPDPQTLAFFEKKKSKGNTEKSKGFCSSRNPYKPWKGEEKHQKKQGKSENEKRKEIEKKQGLEGQGMRSF